MEYQKVREVLARYVRAVDQRSPQAMAKVFAKDGEVSIYVGQQSPQQIGHLAGAEEIAAAVSGMMPAHPDRGWTHHTTTDHIIEIDGDTALMDAQFIVYYTLGANQPDAGWPVGAVGAQGTVRAAEAGYYRSTLKRVDGQWKLLEHRIYLDLPMAF